MQWVSREADRIWQETRKWRDNRHLRFGGRGGFLLTAVALVGAGWTDITTLERVFHLAITPLAVIWGFQQISHPSDGETSVSEQLRASHRAWQQRVEKVAQLSGIFAVVAILMFTALPNDTAKGFLYPVVIVPAALAIGSTRTRILNKYRTPAADSSAAADSPPTTGDSSATNWQMVPLFDLLIISWLIIRAREITRDWHAGIGALLGGFIDERGLWVSIILMLLYEWLTVAKWGGGIGRTLTRTKVVGAVPDRPPSLMRALVRAIGTVCFLSIFTLPAIFYAWFGWQAFTGLLTGGLFLALWFKPIRGRGLRDILSGTRVVSTGKKS